MFETQKKRFLILALCLMLVCSLAVPVSAAEDYLSTYNFSVTTLSSTSQPGVYPSSKLRSVLYNAYFTNSAVIVRCNSLYVYGYHWDEYGRLCSGAWNNPISTVNASLLGVYPESSLTLVESKPYSGNYDGRYIYFSKNAAEQSSDFLTSSVYAVCWDDVEVSSVWFCYYKHSANTTWSTGVSNVSVSLPASDIGNMTSYYASGPDAVLWNVVPEGGTSFGSGGSGGFDSPADPYIYVSIPATVTKGLYIIPRAELMNPGDISGNILCFLSGHNSAYTKLTESDSLDNMWTLDCGRDETASTLTLTFMVEGRPDIYITCTVSVVGSQTDNEGSSGDLRPTEPGDSGESDPTISDLDKEKDEAQNSGNDLLEDLEEVIPDYSDDIGQALGSLASVLIYDGTESVLIIPQWTFPQVGTLIPEHVMWERMEVDMGAYINMLPPDLLLLVQSLLTVALILYCFYELYGTVGLILMPKGGAE